MKKLRILSGIILVITAFLLGGCYTQVAMQDNNSGYYGYGNNNSYPNNQNPADTSYSYQGYQTPADSAYGNQYGYDNNNYYGPGYNNYYGSPYYNGWNSYPSLSLGLSWGGFYNPFYWDPLNLWSYNPYYYNLYNPYGIYYPTYYNPYNYYPYYGGYYSYSTPYKKRSRGDYNLRNNDGGRNFGGRGSVVGSGGTTTTYSPNTVTRSEPNTVSRSGRPARAESPATIRSNNNRPNRIVRSGVSNGRRNTGRNISRQEYYMRRVEHPNYRRNTNGRYQRSNNSRIENRNNRGTARRYEPPRQSYSPPARTYSPPPRSYSPPARSYSPPAGSYSAPRSYSPPSRASASGGRGGGSGRGR